MTGEVCHGRTLKTAHAVLQLLRLLEAAPRGLTSSEVADELGRSRSTAVNLLNTLVAEGFAVHDDITARYCATDVTTTPTRQRSVDIDAHVIAELYARTRERSYLAITADNGVTIEDSRGRQGLPYVPGLRPEITGQAHALAVGKAMLAHLGPEALGSYVDRYGLTAFTTRTVTDVDRLQRQLQEIRRDGVAVDVEEFAPGFCCIAAPILSDDGAPLGAVAVSMNVERFRLRGRQVAEQVAAAADAALHRIDERFGPG
ncbi:MAG: IclR family transcriptional regulator [Nitriliruptoraceae bacterium]